MSDNELTRVGEEPEPRHYRAVIVVGFSTSIDENQITTLMRQDCCGAPAFDVKTWAAFYTRVQSQDEIRATDSVMSEITSLGHLLAGSDSELRRRQLLLLRQERERRDLEARHQRELAQSRS